MAELLFHQPFHLLDRAQGADSVAGARVHLGIASAQRQPLRVDDALVWIDGEIYNQAREHPGPASDAQRLVALLRGGVDQLGRLDGYFAAAVFDPRDASLSLISDAMGLRHLYWSRTQRRGCAGLAWSSELKGFLALADFQARIEPEAVEAFLRDGVHTGERTWFADARLLPAASCLRFELESGRVALQRYEPDAAKSLALAAEASPDELADELARRFVSAVERHAQPGERVGLCLSGGLDSRAILAALPDHLAPSGAPQTVHAVTVGGPDCSEVRLAARAARVRGARHHTVTVLGEDWLASREVGVWWTDGQLDLLHMHSMESLALCRSLFDIHLSGFAGDAVAGGSLLPGLPVDEGVDAPVDGSAARPDDEFAVIERRIRHFTIHGLRLAGVFCEQRMPFLEANLMAFQRSLPRALRERATLYRRALLRRFPQYFESIPWQRTGLPIAAPRAREQWVEARRRAGTRLRKLAARAGWRPRDRSGYTEYSSWLREKHAREFIEDRLLRPNALWRDVAPAAPLLAEWQDLRSGGMSHVRIGRYLTLELWLQQVENARHRGFERKPRRNVASGLATGRRSGRE